MLRFRREVLRIISEDSRAAVEDQDLRFLRTNRAEIVLERVPRDLRQGAGEFNPGGSCTDDHEGEPCLSQLRVGGTLGGFERLEYLVTDCGGFLDRLEAGRPLAPLVVAVVG